MGRENLQGLVSEYLAQIEKLEERRRWLIRNRKKLPYKEFLTVDGRIAAINDEIIELREEADMMNRGVRWRADCI